MAVDRDNVTGSNELGLDKAIRSMNNPDDFDEKAKENAMKVTQLHEFRRDRIKEYTPPERDLFQYTEEDPRKYDALKFESLFKY
jgi:hypothetical protein